MVVTQSSRQGKHAKSSNAATSSVREALEKALATKAAAKEEVAAVVIEDSVTEQTVVVAEVFELTSPTLPAEQIMTLHSNDEPVTLTPSRPSVTPNSCVRALEKAIVFGKQKLYLEVAVSLAYFASSTTGADRATKRGIMDVYTKAGYNTKVDGEDYKTVSRRINAAAALFNKIGQASVLNAMRGLREAKAIDSLCGYLDDTYNFTGINAVLEYAGKPVKQTNTAEARAARAASGEDTATATGIGERMSANRMKYQAPEEDTDGTIVSAGKLSIVVPSDCTVSELRMMAGKLTEFADRLEAALGTPEEQRDREMHS